MVLFYDIDDELVVSISMENRDAENAGSRNTRDTVNIVCDLYALEQLYSCYYINTVMGLNHMVLAFAKESHKY